MKTVSSMSSIHVLNESRITKEKSTLYNEETHYRNFKKDPSIKDSQLRTREQFKQIKGLGLIKEKVNKKNLIIEEMKEKARQKEEEDKLRLERLIQKNNEMTLQLKSLRDMKIMDNTDTIDEINELNKQLELKQNSLNKKSNLHKKLIKQLVEFHNKIENKIVVGQTKLSKHNKNKNLKLLNTNNQIGNDINCSNSLKNNSKNIYRNCRTEHNKSPKNKLNKSLDAASTSSDTDNLDKYIKMKNEQINTSLENEKFYKKQMEKQLEINKKYLEEEYSLEFLLNKKNELYEKINKLNIDLDILNKLKNEHYHYCEKKLKEKNDILNKYKNEFIRIIQEKNIKDQNEEFIKNRNTMIKKNSYFSCTKNKAKNINTEPNNLNRSTNSRLSVSSSLRDNLKLKKFKNKLKPIWNEFKQVNENYKKNQKLATIQERLKTNQSESMKVLFDRGEKKILKQLIPDDYINKLENKYTENDQKLNEIESKLKNDFLNQKMLISNNKDKVKLSEQALKNENCYKVKIYSVFSKQNRSIVDLKSKIKSIQKEFSYYKSIYDKKHTDNQDMKKQCNDLLETNGKEKEYLLDEDYERIRLEKLEAERKEKEELERKKKEEEAKKREESEEEEEEDEEEEYEDEDITNTMNRHEDGSFLDKDGENQRDDKEIKEINELSPIRSKNSKGEKKVLKNVEQIDEKYDAKDIISRDSYQSSGSGDESGSEN